MKEKLLLLGVIFLLVAAAVIGYSVYSKPSVTDLLIANIEALTRNETDEVNRKLTVCLCSDVSPENGYYDWANMKNHCHDGIGNDCAGRVYNCPYTWYCNL